MAKTNHIASGALFKDAQINDGKKYPVMHIALDVLGVKLNLAVWPAEKSWNGTTYWPVNGDYHIREARRLVDVTPVFNAAQTPREGEAGAPSADASAAPAALSAGGDDLPL